MATPPRKPPRQPTGKPTGKPTLALPAPQSGARTSLRQRIDAANEAAPARNRREEARAVALRYSAEEMDAPKVVATGRGHVADQIVRLALDSGVKVREDADLAEILSLLDVDQAIPPEAYVAVAEILAYVYQAEGKKPAPAPATKPVTAKATGGPKPAAKPRQP